MDWLALTLSLRLAGATAFFLFAVGLPFAFYLSRREGFFTHAVEAFLSLPMVLPPTVLGFYLLLVLGPLGWAFSFGGLLIASVISSLPFALQSFLAGFRSVNKSYYEASFVLGEGEWRTFWRVAIPLAREGILTGVILAFAHALGEFGVVLMIGGNIPGATRTLSIALYDQVESFQYEAANRTAVALLAFSVLSMMAVALLRGRARR